MAIHPPFTALKSGSGIFLKVIGPAVSTPFFGGRHGKAGRVLPARLGGAWGLLLQYNDLEGVVGRVWRLGAGLVLAEEAKAACTFEEGIGEPVQLASVH